MPMQGIPQPEPGAFVPVAQGVWRLTLPMRFNPGHVNSYLLRDVAGWTAIDCGNFSAETRQTWQQWLDRDSDGLPLDRIILTHAHPDHYGSAPWLCEQTGATLHMAAAEWDAVNRLWRGSADRPDELARFYQRWHASEAEVASILDFMRVFQLGCPEFAAEPALLSPDDCVTIAGQHWQLLPGFGHTPCNLLLYRPDDGVLITGDQVLPTIVPNISLWAGSDENPMQLALDTLSKLAGLRVSVALPAHGAPFSDFAARCGQITAVYEKRLERLVARLAAGPASVAELAQAALGKLAQGPMFMLVAGQLYALLSCLAARGDAVITETGFALSAERA